MTLSVRLDHCSVHEILTGWTYKLPLTARRAKRENSGLGHPGPKDLLVSHRTSVSKSSYFLGDPPPDPRLLASLGSLSLVELDHCSVLEVLTGWTYNLPLTACRAKRENGGLGHPGPKDLLVSHRTSWGILPHTPRFLASLGALSLVELPLGLTS
jgi:hypothetical protein